MKKIEIATQILAGMCAGDWQMHIPEGQTWDDVAVPRAFDLAEKVMQFNAFGTIPKTEVKIEQQDFQ
jgi:hypothetical protein